MGTETGGHGQLVVALHGRSLMLSGVARRLARQTSMRVVAIDGPIVADALGALDPDALVIDLATVPIESALALLRDRPELLLVGLEASGARLIVLAGEQSASVGTDDLIALIERGRGPSETTRQRRTAGKRSTAAKTRGQATA